MRFILAAMTLAITSGCTTVQNADGSQTVQLTVPNMASLIPLPTIVSAQPKGSKPSVPTAVGLISNATPLSKTVLAGIFRKYPYDGTPKTTYPRVALTITDWSRTDCWTANAVVWWSSKKSQTVRNFYSCMDSSLGGALNGVVGFQTFIGQTQVFDNSGNVRTTGPRAPLMAIPTSSPVDFSDYLTQVIVETGWEGGVPETNFWLVGFNRKG